MIHHEMVIMELRTMSYGLIKDLVMVGQRQSSMEVVVIFLFRTIHFSMVVHKSVFLLGLHGQMLTQLNSEVFSEIKDTM